MLKKLDNLKGEELKKMILNGPCFALYCANKDKEDYKKYNQNKKNKLEFSEERSLEMEILILLKKLGYSLQHLGTYLYKDVIVEAMKEIKKIDGDSEAYEELKISLNNAYSNLYGFIARDYYEMGINAFHLYIQRALCDVEPKDGTIIPTDEDVNYGMYALCIAEYMLDKSKVKDDMIEQPKIKKLTNMPENIKLKKMY